MEKKFTEGEWTIKKSKTEFEKTIISNNGKRIAEVKSYYGFDFNDPTIDERIANCKLICAAPDMIEALLETDKDLCVLESTMSQIEATDARAEGMTELVKKWRERNQFAIKKATK